MSVEFDDKDVTYDIQKTLNKLPDLVDKQMKVVLGQIGAIVKKNLQRRLPRTVEDLANYDGTRPRVHVEDDIKIKTVNKNGWASVTIHGGKKTAFKWHLLNDGTRDPNGAVHTPATHFIDLAMQDSEAEIDKLIDQIVEGVCDENID